MTARRSRPVGTPARPQALVGWAAGMPVVTSVLADDAAALTAFVDAGEAHLAALPPRPSRSPQEQHAADLVLTACRQARSRFMARHAGAVYDETTSGRTAPRRLSEVVSAAAVRFPGLVPDRAQLAAERARAQSEKDGREIDQGIFFSAVLSSPEAGLHLMRTMLTPCPRAIGLRADFSRSGRIELPSVLLERQGHAAHLTVRNLHCLNAEDDQLADDMETAVDLVLLDERSRVGVVRGGTMTHPRYAGRRVFSAGINLKALRAGQISYVDFLLRREMTYLAKLVHGLLPAPDAGADAAVHKPWIAAVDSFAVGGGMQLLFCFDWVISADDAFFSLPAAREGIVPGAANLRLGRFAGGRLARQIILRGRRVTADEPAARLFCDEVVPATEVTARTDVAARELDSPAVTANRRMLNLAEEPLDRLREYLAVFARVQAERIYGPDVLENVDPYADAGRT